MTGDEKLDYQVLVDNSVVGTFKTPELAINAFKEMIALKKSGKRISYYENPVIYLKYQEKSFSAD